MEFKVGDRCQWHDRDTDELTGGTVESVIPPKRMKTNDWWNTSKYSEQDRADMVTYAVIKWDDGTSDTVDMDDLDQEDSALEREFRNVATEATTKIMEKVRAASKLLQEAVDISEQYGIPFSSEISFLGQPYKPASFEDKFGDIDDDFVDSVTGAYCEYEV
jgi:ribosomal protein L14E/L6E/L27E